MKILHKGGPLFCTCCGCVFEFEEEDIKVKEEVENILDLKIIHIEDRYKIKYVECPQCKEHIELAAELIN